MKFGTKFSETGFLGVLKWPSMDSPYSELARLMSQIDHRSSEALVTIGLVDPSTVDGTDNPRDTGDITAMIHAVGNKENPATLDEDDWRMIQKLRLKDDGPGVYPLSYPDSWIVLLPEWKGFSWTE